MTYWIRSVTMGIVEAGAHAGMVAAVVDLGPTRATETSGAALAEQVARLLEATGAPPGQEGACCWAVLAGDAVPQLDQELVAAFHARRVRISVETDGAVLLPRGVDWVTLVPVRGADDRAVVAAKELRVVLPGEGWTHPELESLAASGSYGHLYVQPEHDADVDLCTAFVLAHPRWRVAMAPRKINGRPKS